MAERIPRQSPVDPDRWSTGETGSEPDREGLGETASAASIAPAPEPAVNVVPLFAGQAEAGIDPDPSDEAPTDWPSAIQMIREVGTQVRRERDLAQHLVKQSRTLVQRSVVQVEEAEKRAEAAQADAAQASLRAERAEERARLAEERAKQAEERAQIARAGEEEAQLWLRRLYACLRRELGDLASDPR